MVYTDFFVRGREPVRSCDAHTSYSPYPEPAFAATAFDTLPALMGMERVVPDPVPISAPPPPYPPAAYSPPMQKREIALPAAPPDPQPEPLAPRRSDTLAPALPPPEPVEAPPQ
jgi:hypothetical protein